MKGKYEAGNKIEIDRQGQKDRQIKKRVREKDRKKESILHE